jgi:hypothetical protein
VGYVVGVDGHHTVFVTFSVGERATILRIFRDRIEGSADLYFTSNDCSGTPFDKDFEIPVNALFTKAIVVDGTLYLPDPEGSVQTIDVYSLGSLGGGANCLSENRYNGTRAFPQMAVMDLSSEFTPPFSVR